MYELFGIGEEQLMKEALQMNRGVSSIRTYYSIFSMNSCHGTPNNSYETSVSWNQQVFYCFG